MLQLSSLSKSYGAVHALRPTNLQIPAGQMVGVIGRSGAGKSTLLRLLNRLTEPSNGRIDFDGTNVTLLQGRDLRMWRASCAMIFQQFNLVPRLDVITNVLLGAVAMASLVCALFFLRFWRTTHDRFFLLFALAFAIDAATRFALSLSSVTAEYQPFFYSLRLLTFGLIIVAIIDKNRSNNRAP